MNGMMSVREAAAYSRYTEQTLRAYMSRGWLPYHKSRGRTLIAVSDMDDFMDVRRRDSADAAYAEFLAKREGMKNEKKKIFRRAD